MNSMDAFWMPFTANREFKVNPRLVETAEGMYFTTADGRRVLDGLAGLWCVNAGHLHPHIVERTRAQLGRLDYTSSFQMSHPAAFNLANRLTAMMPEGFSQVFFTNSGSESVETALKIALGYQTIIGQGSRFRLIGRERGYHGVGFGGTSVGGMPPMRKGFGPLLPGVDHIRHTHDLSRNAFTRGQPEHGADFAEDLERVVELHGAGAIAAVIVEPFSGGGGVLLPPKGYLEQLRKICTAHGILLIFDEVITAFGRFGAATAAEYFGVTPDIIVTAKALTNGTVPMGAVFVKGEVYQAFLSQSKGGVELYHGFTYSAHPLACAAADATMDVYENEGLFDRVTEIAPLWEDMLHGLSGAPGVVDVRNLGLLGAVEIDNRDGGAAARATRIGNICWENGLLLRASGANLVLTPPLIITPAEIAFIGETLGTALSD
jgi:beta-alanine--pyruvate transaminase